MSRDIYSSMSGASAAWKQMEVIAHNLANVNTAGFREQRVSFSLGEQSPELLGQAYVDVTPGGHRHDDGALVRDEIATHLALRGPGYFVVGEGEESRLMRAGAFSLDAEGCLVTQHGLKVQGVDGEIRLPEGEAFTVAADGTIKDQDGHELNRVLVVESAAVEPKGQGAWKALAPVTEVEGTRVMQGALEASNVDAIRGMTELIEASRYFEAYQKAMQASDEMDANLHRIAGS